MKERRKPFQKAFVVTCIGCIVLLFLLICVNTYRSSDVQGHSPPTNQTRQASHSSRCLSRIQLPLYQKDSQRFSPSMELKNEWTRYTELHSSCSQGKNWNKVFSKEQQKPDPCKYLVYIENRFGLGNRILGLVSAFAFALAADRVLLIEPNKLLGPLLCEPFPGSSWLLPKDFPFEDVRKSPSLGAVINQEFKNLSMVTLHLEHVQDWGDQQFFCDYIHNSLKHIRWVGWVCNQYYVTQLFMIPSIWKRLDPLFPSKTHVFPQLSQLLLLPSNDLWDIIVHTYRAYHVDSRTLVGLQIRTLYRKYMDAFDPMVHSRITDCLATHKVLDAQIQANATEGTAEKMGEEVLRDVLVLVASLQGKYQTELKEYYRHQPHIHVHMVSHLIVFFVMTSSTTLCDRDRERFCESHQDKSLSQARLAFVEMWLLSFSDVLATSASSTFGYIAQGIGGLQPYILDIARESAEQDEQPPCMIGQSSEPCTHFVMRPVCEGTNVSFKHQNWMTQHLKPCQDFSSGLQLVDP